MAVDGVKAEKLMYQYMVIWLIFKLFHSPLQRSVLSVNLSENIKITKPVDVRFSSNSSESRNNTTCLFLHKDTQALSNYFDERITPEEAHVVPLQMSVYDNFDKFMIIKRRDTLVVLISSSDIGITSAKTYCEQYNRLIFTMQLLR